MRKFPLLLSVVLIFTIALVYMVTGCQGTETIPTSEEQSITEEVTDEDVIKIGYLSYKMNHHWFNSVHYFSTLQAKEIEEEEGVKFEYVLFDGGGVAENQVKQVDDLITMGDIDMVLFQAIDEKSMAKAVKKINDELGIPVGSDGTPAAGGNFIFTGLDNVEASEKIGNYLVDELNEKYGDPSQWGGDNGGVIIEIWGPPGLQIAKDRHIGFRKVMDPILEENPDIKIVEGTSDWNVDKAVKVMSDFVQRYGDEIIGIYTDDDVSAVEGAYRALELADLAYPVGDPNHIPIVSYDGAMTAVDAIRENKIDMTIHQPAVAYSRLTLRYLYNWYKEGYDSLPKVGDVLTVEELSEYFDPDTTGSKYWGPVEVRQGPNYDGIWLVPQGPIIPDEEDPYEKSQWGNYNYYLEYGEYPTKEETEIE